MKEKIWLGCAVTLQHTALLLVIGQPRERYSLIQSAVPWEEHYAHSVNTNHPGLSAPLSDIVFFTTEYFTFLLCSLITKLTLSHTLDLSSSVTSSGNPSLASLNREEPPSTVLYHPAMVLKTFTGPVQTLTNRAGLIRMDSRTRSWRLLPGPGTDRSVLTPGVAVLGVLETGLEGPEPQGRGHTRGSRRQLYGFLIICCCITNLPKP